MGVRIGDRNTKIDLEAKVVTPDEMGGFTSTWKTVVAGVWASIWPLKGNESSIADKQTGTATHRVRIRFRRGVRADWRVKVSSNRYFSICSEPIDLQNRHEDLEMLCKEVRA